jgi:hypothetical protein
MRLRVFLRGTRPPGCPGDRAARCRRLTRHLTWEALSVDVRWRPPPSVAIVTWSHGRSLADGADRTCAMKAVSLARTFSYDVVSLTYSRTLGAVTS